MGIKDKLGMPSSFERKIGHNGKGYRIYKYPSKDKQLSGPWITFIFGVAFWGFVVFAIISNNS